MSRVLCYLPGNVFHSNVSAAKRRAYMENIHDWLEVLGQAGVPVVTSFQQIDLELMELEVNDFTDRGIELLHAPYNHALPTLLFNGGFEGHAKWLLEHGVKGNVDGEFYPEFDIPRANRMLPAKDRIVFSLANQYAVHYSECQGGDVQPCDKLGNLEVLRYGDRVVVPMRGAEHVVNKFFFPWQRFWTKEHLDALMYEIQKIVHDGEDRIVVFFVDLEAPMVGSRHGLEVWRKFFEALNERGLVEGLASFREAAEHWRSVAKRDKSVSTRSIISRHLGQKWIGLGKQNEYVMIDLLRSNQPKSDRDHREMALASTSDVLSAWEKKINGVATLSTDGESIIIGYDQTIITLALSTLKAYKTRRSVPDTLRLLEKLEDDGRWFVNRVANNIDGAYGL